MKWQWSCNYLYWLSRYLVVIIDTDWVIVFRRCGWSLRQWSVLWCWHRQLSDKLPPTYHQTSCLQPVSYTVSGEIITKLLVILLKNSINHAAHILSFYFMYMYIHVYTCMHFILTHVNKHRVIFLNELFTHVVYLNITITFFRA